MNRFLCIFIFTLFLTSGYCQEEKVVLDESAVDSTTIINNSFFDIFYGNPGKAAFYGLIAPGGGQIYNKRWWKLPLVYGLEGGLIFFIYDNTRLYREYQKVYINNLNSDNDILSFEGVSDTGILKTRRDKYRQRREYAWVAFIGGHLITIFEAFIDRHLIEFDVSDDLTMAPISSPIGTIGAITYTIPLNKKKNIVFKNLLVN